MSPVARFVLIAWTLGVVAALLAGAIFLIYALLVLVEGKVVPFALAMLGGAVSWLIAWLLGRGVTKFKRAAYARAIAAAAEALRDDPGTRASHNNRGLLCQQRGNYAQAIAHFDAALRLDPTTPEPYVGRVNAYGAIGQLQRMVDEYTAALESDPKHALAYCARATAYNRLGRPERSIPDATEAIRLAPDLYLGYDARGYGLLLRAGLSPSKRLAVSAAEGRVDLARAVADFTEAIRLRPEAWDCYEGRAAARAALGERAQAADDARTAASLRHRASVEA